MDTRLGMSMDTNLGMGERKGKMPWYSTLVRSKVRSKRGREGKRCAERDGGRTSQLTVWLIKAKDWLVYPSPPGPSPTPPTLPHRIQQMEVLLWHFLVWGWVRRSRCWVVAFRVR